MLASRTSERICHRLNRVPDAVPAHTQARRAGFILKDAVATCKDGLRSFVALHDPCVGHKSSRNRHRIPRRTQIRTARRALLLLATKHAARDSAAKRVSHHWRPSVPGGARRTSVGLVGGARGRPRVFCACTACTHRNMFLARHACWVDLCSEGVSSPSSSSLVTGSRFSMLGTDYNLQQIGSFLGINYKVTVALDQTAVAADSKFT